MTRREQPDESLRKHASIDISIPNCALYPACISRTVRTATARIKWRPYVRHCFRERHFCIDTKRIDFDWSPSAQKYSFTCRTEGSKCKYQSSEIQKCQLDTGKRGWKPLANPVKSFDWVSSLLQMFCKRNHQLRRALLARENHFCRVLYAEENSQHWSVHMSSVVLWIETPSL